MTPARRPAAADRRNLRPPLAVALGLAGLWLGFVWLLAPHLIRMAWAGRGPAFLASLLQGRATHPVSGYLHAWSRFARVSTVGLVAAGLAAAVVLRFGDRIERVWRPYLRPEHSIPPVTSLLLSAWIGLIAGFAEFLSGAIKYRIDGVFSEWSNPDSLWMAPLGLALLFALTDALLLTVTASWRRTISFRLVLAIPVALGLLSVTRSLRLGVHPLALGVLVCGAAVAASAAAKHRSGTTIRLMRSTAFPLALAIPVLAISSSAVRILAERRSLAALPPPPTGAPNILLVILDTVREQELSLYGYTRPTTPELENLARNAIVFDNAFATAPWTLTSHASLLTGRYPVELSTGWRNPLDQKAPTLAAVLAARGYNTAGFVANLNYCTRRSGLQRGFAHYEDYDRSAANVLASSWLTARLALWIGRRLGRPPRLVRVHAPDINREFEGWLDRAGDRPFFAFLNYYDTHDPYEWHDSAFAGLGYGREPDSVRNAQGRRVSRSPGSRHALDAYDSSLRFLDHQLGALFDELRRRDLLQNTLLIVTADHGEQFAEHGLTHHGNSLFSQLLHVPLIIRPPAGGGKRVDEPVGLIDVPATILAAAGVARPPLQRGVALDRFWSGSTAAPSPGGAIVSELEPNVRDRGLAGPARLGPMRSLVLDHWHYIRNGDRSEALFDILLDPLEDRDLTRSPDGQAVLPGLRTALDSVLDALPSPAAAERTRPATHRAALR